LLYVPPYVGLYWVPKIWEHLWSTTWVGDIEPGWSHRNTPFCHLGAEFGRFTHWIRVQWFYVQQYRRT